jgi:ApbE superfamily uncharacterized protein (UPF0280 family)
MVHPEGVVTFSVRVKETDLHIWAERDLSSQALETVLTHRRALERFLAEHPGLSGSLTPVPHRAGEPPVWSRMVDAAAAAQVGPMAAVAGAFSDLVGETMAGRSHEVMVENGGDIFLLSSRPRRLAVWGDPGSFAPSLTLEVSPGRWGICTSSATVGHSLSFGKASAVTVLAASAAVADALATRYCNATGYQGIDAVLEEAGKDPSVLGIAVVSGGRVGVAGGVRLVV